MMPRDGYFDTGEGEDHRPGVGGRFMRADELFVRSVRNYPLFALCGAAMVGYLFGRIVTLRT